MATDAIKGEPLSEAEQYEAERYPFDTLKAIRRKHLFENRLDDFKRMAKKGALDAEVEQRARECQEYAHELIAQGWFYGEAWYHATAYILRGQNVD